MTHDTGNFPLLRLALLLGGALMSGWVATTVRASTRTEVLEAIHCVENPHDTTRAGKCGELGPYQFRRSTWGMHSNLPFDRALERAEAEKVAIRHYEWLRRGLERNGVAATPYNIALAWNAGLLTAVRGRANVAARDYAERVANLAKDFQTTRVAAVP